MKLVGMELRKAMGNPWFLASLCAGIVLGAASACMFSGAEMLDMAVGMVSDGKFCDPNPANCFSKWMSVDFNAASGLFYRLAPLLAVLPYSCSMRSELKSGYADHMYTRSTRLRYIGAKHVAALCAGGLVVTIPQIVNILLVACRVPAYTPEVFSSIYQGIFEDNLWSGLFYTEPVAYVASYLLMDFLLCGLWAGFVLALSLFVRNRVVLLAGPCLALIAWQFFNENVFLALGGVRGVQLSLFENLRAGTSLYTQDGWIILAEGLAVLLTTAILTFAGKGRDAV